MIASEAVRKNQAPPKDIIPFQIIGIMPLGTSSFQNCCELVAPLYRGGRVGRFLEQLEPAQDELGHYMDLMVALRLAHDVIDAGEARAWFNVG